MAICIFLCVKLYFKMIHAVNVWLLILVPRFSSCEIKPSMLLSLNYTPLASNRIFLYLWLWTFFLGTMLQYNTIAKLGGQYIVSLTNWWALWNLTMLIHLLYQETPSREASLCKFLLLWMVNGLRTEPLAWVIHIKDFLNILFEFWEFSGQVQCPNGMDAMTRHSFSSFTHFDNRQS